MTVKGAKINPQLPGLQKGVEAERNSVQLQSPVRSIMAFTFSMCEEDCRQMEFTKFIFWHLCQMLIMHASLNTLWMYGVCYMLQCVFCYSTDHTADTVEYTQIGLVENKANLGMSLSVQK